MGITLTLQELEKIAEKIHNRWTANREAEGWTPGEIRDDCKKQHPCLIPYIELPESEKEYDRATALETIKTLYEMGYELVKPDRKQ